MTDSPKPLDGAGKSSTSMVGWGVVAALLLVMAVVAWWIYNSSSSELVVLGEDVASVRAIKESPLTGASLKQSGARVQVLLEKYDVLVGKSNQDFANKTGVYDVVLQYNTALASYIDNGYVYTLAELKQQQPKKREALEEIEKDLFLRTWKEVGWYRNRAGDDVEPIAIPFAANTMFLCYNKELFADQKHKDAFREKYKAELKVPTDWEQFYKIAEYFTVPGRTYGLCLQGAPGAIYWEWANFAFSFGGGVLKNKTQGWEGSEATPLILTSPETAAATRYYLSLKPFDASKDFFNTEPAHQVRRMEVGDVAMCVMWSDEAYGLVKERTSGGRFAFAPIPGKKSMLAGGSYYVNRSSKKVDAAVEYIISVMSKEMQKKLTLKGLCSARTSVYSDPDVLNNVPYAKALEESLQRGVYMLEAGPESEAITNDLSDMLQELFRKHEAFADAKKLAELLETTEQKMLVKRTEIFKQLKAVNKNKEKAP